MNLSDKHELYLSRMDLRPSSKRFKNRALKHFIHYFGDMDADKVTTEHAEEFRRLLAIGRSKRAANGYIANFKPFWVWLHLHGHILKNPFLGLRLYRITKPERTTFSADELSKMLKFASQLWRVRICFGLLGMRRGEMLNVTECDIKMETNQPHIILQKKKATDRTWPFDLKDHANRYVALPEKMVFADIIVYLHKDVKALMNKMCPYICLEEKYWLKLLKWQKKGKPEGSKTPFEEDILDPTGNFQRMFRNLQKKAGIKQTKTYHELRATFATKMIENCGLKRTSVAMGHSSPKTTMGYDRSSEMSLVESISKATSECYQTNVR